MKASNLTTSEILQLSQHLEESGLPEGCRDDLLAQCDQLAMQGSHQSAVKLSQQQQSCDNLTNYLTAGDWKALKQLPFWQGANTLIVRLKKIGLQSLSGSLKKRCLGVLVITEMEKGKPFPAYRDIYNLAHQFSAAFAACTHTATPGVPSLLTYPMEPSLVSQTFVATAYDPADPPVAKHLDDLNFLVLHHLPVRKTSKLLREDSSDIFSKRPKKRTSTCGENDLEDRVADMVVNKVGSKLQKLLEERGQTTTPVARPLLGDSKAWHVAEGNKTVTMRTKALQSLPSSNSFTSSQLEEESQQEQVQTSAQLALPAPEPLPEQGNQETENADELEMEAFNKLKNKDAAKKGNKEIQPKPAKSKAKSQPKPASKTKQASKEKAPPVLKRPAAKGHKTPSAPAAQPEAPEEELCWGCLRCRGNQKGCSECRRKGFAGLRCCGREAWKAALSKRGKSWK